MRTDDDAVPLRALKTFHACVIDACAPIYLDKKKNKKVKKKHTIICTPVTESCAHTHTQTHVFSVNPRRAFAPVLRTQFTTALHPPLAPPPPLSSRRPFRYTPAPSFSGVSLHGGRNHSAFPPSRVRALSGKRRFALLSSRTVPSADRLSPPVRRT